MLKSKLKNIIAGKSFNSFLKEKQLFEISGVSISSNLFSLLLPALLMMNLLFVSLPAFVGAYAAYMCIIVFHEMGHAMLAKKVGLPVTGIYIKWYGGYCRFARPPNTHRDAALIAFGGPGVQFLLAIPALLLVFLFQLNPLTMIGSFVLILTKWNIIMALLNLIPIGPLDGKVIWNYLKNKTLYDKLDK